MKALTGQLPPGGWHLPVMEDVVLEAPTKDLLIKMVFDWRLRNGYAPGDVEKDIDDFVCSQWPKYCGNTPNEIATENKGVDLDKRVASYAASVARNMPRGGYEVTPTLQAVERAKICTACSSNLLWKKGCGSCSNSTENLLYQVRGMRSVPGETALGACNITGNELKTDVWLDTQRLSEESPLKEALPQNCWKLRELQD